jgi:hypothetical protein
VHIDTDKVQDKPTEYFKQFDIVIATDMDVDNMVGSTSPLSLGRLY